MPRGAKHWSFTTNNWKSEHVFTELPEGFVYLVVGREVGEAGTRHLQGCFGLARKRERSWLVKNIPQLANSHLEPSRKPPAAVQYCKKEGDFDEFGEPPLSSVQGRRGDLDAFKQAVSSGCYDIDRLREEHSEVVAKYPRFVQDYINQKRPRREPKSHELRDWQVQLREKLEEDPDERVIHFVVDYKGNEGKSWFLSWYGYHYEKVQILAPGKKADMVYALKQNNRVLFIDCPRSKQGEFIQYDFLEEVKNGRVFSGKYESNMKELDPCHVVVMMNEMPDMTKLSEDRYDIIPLNSPSAFARGFNL